MVERFYIEIPWDLIFVGVLLRVCFHLISLTENIFFEKQILLNRNFFCRKKFGRQISMFALCFEGFMSTFSARYEIVRNFQ